MYILQWGRRRRGREEAEYYWELAAKRGDATASRNRGAIEGNASNVDRAVITS